MESAQPKRRGGRAHHSAMEPHFEAIRQWRRQRKTWKEIAGLLATEKGIHVTLYAPYRFMRRRLKRPVHWEDESTSSPAPPESQPVRPKTSAIQPPIAPALPGDDFKRPDRKSFNPDEYL
jgi:hypothetical protein